MCTGFEPMLLAGLAGGAALSTIMAPKVPAPQIADPVKPPAPTSQTAKAPDRAAAVTANAAAAAPGGMLGGNGGTFLTGPSGVDASTLNLGKNKLLGQ